jgi:phosphate transport system permease protein
MSKKSIKHKKGGFFGLSFDQIVKYFFCGNAFVAVVVLGLITFFLYHEGADFFPENWRSLVLYRRSGQEYVDYLKAAMDDHSALNRYLQDLRDREMKSLLKTKSPAQAQAALADFDKFSDAFDSTTDDLQGMVSDLTDAATAIKDKVKINQDRVTERNNLLKAGREKEAAAIVVPEIDYEKELAPIVWSLPAFRQKAAQLKNAIEGLTASLPVLPAPEFQLRMDKFKDLTRQYLSEFPVIEQKLESWNSGKPVPWDRAVTTFFGSKWITNSYWQDWYGILPLLAGSIMVSFIAMMIAVPLGVFSAIYVSEIATVWEKKLIKPYIEFISAIPSVVLGFFGVVVLGEALRTLSQQPFLASWFPGFPMAERLNAFTAGCLLALMAIPTIFTLSEDALNNVPLAFKEASYAMGANRLQTIIRILVPASLSGIISAVLLGFGRVIGETMVVLLCAGNRIQIPDFTQGIGAFFQPVHTMTGIIAQDMGEVERGSIQYRALFMIGIVLFLAALVINFMAQKVVRKYKISIG